MVSGKLDMYLDMTINKKNDMTQMNTDKIIDKVIAMSGGLALAAAKRIVEIVIDTWPKGKKE